MPFALYAMNSVAIGAASTLSAVVVRVTALNAPQGSMSDKLTLL